MYILIYLKSFFDFLFHIDCSLISDIYLDCHQIKLDRGGLNSSGMMLGAKLI